MVDFCLFFLNFIVSLFSSSLGVCLFVLFGLALFRIVFMLFGLEDDNL